MQRRAMRQAKQTDYYASTYHSLSAATLMWHVRALQPVFPLISQPHLYLFLFALPVFVVFVCVCVCVCVCVVLRCLT
jgi:hypothetical protein